MIRGDNAVTQKENDALDSILDAMPDDDEVEKKIDEFARNKHRSARVQRARQATAEFTRAYSSSKDVSAGSGVQEAGQAEGDAALTNPEANKESTASGSTESADSSTAGDTNQKIEQTLVSNDLSIPDFVQNRSQNTEPIVLGAAQNIENIPHYETQQNQPKSSVPEQADAQSGGATRVFGTSIPAAHEQEGQTVSVSSEEIQHLIDQDEPLLKREYLEEDDSEDDHEIRPPKSSGFNWKFAAGIGGAVLAAALLFGGYTMLQSSFSNPPAAEKENTEDFNRLMEWIDGYDELDDEQKKEIKDYRTIFSSLNADQKKQINEKLEALTGKNFNELLAAANTMDKPDSKNENTANAEKKAELKSQIDGLRTEVASLQNQLSSVQSDINTKQNDYNQKVGIQDARRADFNQAESNLNKLTSEKTSLQNDQQSYYIQIQQLQKQIDKLPPAESDDNQNPAPSDDRKNLEKQIDDLNDKLDQVIARLNEIDPEISQAQSAYDKAKDAYDKAASEADASKAQYDAVAGTDGDIQYQINTKNDEIARLQAQYDSIQ